MNRLEGKVALITGASGGIGLAIAQRFCREGAHVIATDLAEKMPEPIGDLKGAVAYIRLDVTQPYDWDAAFAFAVERYGKVDILVNNAGTSRSGSIEDASVEDWHFVMDTNLLSVFLGCQTAVRHMRDPGGVIINIASARGQRPGAAQCAYSASKAAVLSLTESVALHCGENQIPVRCNAICPGVVDTPLLRRYAAELGEEGNAMLIQVAAKHGILGRLAMPEEMANATLFVASEEAAFMTGSTLSVDGGFRIRDK